VEIYVVKSKPLEEISRRSGQLDSAASGLLPDTEIYEFGTTKASNFLPGSPTVMKCNQTWKESQFLTVVLEPRETSGTLSTV
jgi:hypothetical protein